MEPALCQLYWHTFVPYVEVAEVVLRPPPKSVFRKTFSEKTQKRKIMERKAHVYWSCKQCLAEIVSILNVSFNILTVSIFLSLCSVFMYVDVLY